MSSTLINHDLLFEDYLANRLTAEGVVELKRVLSKDKETRARFVKVLQEWELMAEAARQITANSSAAIVEHMVSDIVTDSGNRELSVEAANARRRPSLRVSPTRPHTRRAIGMLISTGALAASIALVFMLTAMPEATVMPLATMSYSSGQIVITRAKKQFEGKIGTPLFAGDRIEVSDGAVADFQYLDSTSVHIDQRTNVRLLVGGPSNQASKRIALKSGRINADVTKQPVGQPMILTTANAQAEVLGTSLTLEFTDSLESTRLEVDHGLVVITDLKNNTRVEVPTGHYSTVMDNQLSIARPLVHRPVEVAKDYRPGLRATYFADHKFQSKMFDRVESGISADLGLESRTPGEHQSEFSVRWDGYLQPLFSEKYLFTLRADAGVRMYLDDKIIIDAWNSAQMGDHQASVKLDASKRHQIRVEYRQSKSGMLIRMVWVSPSQKVEIVPVERLSTDK